MGGQQPGKVQKIRDSIARTKYTRQLKKSTLRQSLASYESGPGRATFMEMKNNLMQDGQVDLDQLNDELVEEIFDMPDQDSSCSEDEEQASFVDHQSSKDLVLSSDEATMGGEGAPVDAQGVQLQRVEVASVNNQTNVQQQVEQLTPEPKGASTDCTDRTSPEFAWKKQRLINPVQQSNRYTFNYQRNYPNQEIAYKRKSASSRSRGLVGSDDMDSSIFTDQISDSTYMAFASKIQLQIKMGLYPQVTKEWLKYMIVESHLITKNNLVIAGGIDYRHSTKPVKVILNGIVEVPADLESCPAEHAIKMGFRLDHDKLMAIEESYQYALIREFRGEQLVNRFIVEQRDVFAIYKKITKNLKQNDLNKSYVRSRKLLLKKILCNENLLNIFYRLTGRPQRSSHSGGTNEGIQTTSQRKSFESTLQTPSGKLAGSAKDSFSVANINKTVNLKQGQEIAYNTTKINYAQQSERKSLMSFHPQHYREHNGISPRQQSFGQEIGSSNGYSNKNKNTMICSSQVSFGIKNQANHNTSKPVQIHSAVATLTTSSTPQGPVYTQKLQSQEKEKQQRMALFSDTLYSEESQIDKGFKEKPYGLDAKDQHSHTIDKYQGKNLALDFNTEFYLQQMSIKEQQEYLASNRPKIKLNNKQKVNNEVSQQAKIADDSENKEDYQPRENDSLVQDVNDHLFQYKQKELQINQQVQHINSQQINQQSPRVKRSTRYDQPKHTFESQNDENQTQQDHKIISATQKMATLNISNASSEDSFDQRCVDEQMNEFPSHKVEIDGNQTQKVCTLATHENQMVSKSPTYRINDTNGSRHAEIQRGQENIKSAVVTKKVKGISRFKRLFSRSPKVKPDYKHNKNNYVAAKTERATDEKILEEQIRKKKIELAQNEMTNSKQNRTYMKLNQLYFQTDPKESEQLIARQDTFDIYKINPESEVNFYQERSKDRINDDVEYDKQMMQSGNYTGVLGIKNMQVSEVVSPEKTDRGRVINITNAKVYESQQRPPKSPRPILQKSRENLNRSEMNNSIKRKVSFEINQSRDDSRNEDSIGINKCIDSFVTSEEWDIDEKNRIHRHGFGKKKAHPNNSTLPFFGKKNGKDQFIKHQFAALPIFIVQKRPPVRIVNYNDGEMPRQEAYLQNKKHRLMNIQNLGSVSSLSDYYISLHSIQGDINSINNEEQSFFKEDITQDLKILQKEMLSQEKIQKQELQFQIMKYQRDESSENNGDMQMHVYHNEWQEQQKDQNEINHCQSSNLQRRLKVLNESLSETSSQEDFALRKDMQLADQASRQQHPNMNQFSNSKRNNRNNQQYSNSRKQPTQLSARSNKDQKKQLSRSPYREPNIKVKGTIFAHGAYHRDMYRPTRKDSPNNCNTTQTIFSPRSYKFDTPTQKTNQTEYQKPAAGANRGNILRSLRKDMKNYNRNGLSPRQKQSSKY